MSRLAIIGNLQKMATNIANPIKYWLQLGSNTIPLNEYLGKKISLVHTGKISCIACGKTIKKSYQHGYCFPCTKTLAKCDLCVIKPELCHYHQGSCREPNWGKECCLVPHIVYLANSSNLKVGITREEQVPTRWIDQGAVQALPIIRTKTRYQAGLIEACFAKFVADKTNWRKMLQGNIEQINLADSRNSLFNDTVEQIQNIAAQFDFGSIELLTAEKILDLAYPVLEYPKKIVSLNFDKKPAITGTLLGIKGQYWIIEQGVLNIRNFTGYEVVFG